MYILNVKNYQKIKASVRVTLKGEEDGNKIEMLHHEPLVYRLYDYLKDNHLGRENGIKKPELAKNSI